MAYNKKNVLEANTEAIRVVLRLEKEVHPTFRVIRQSCSAKSLSLK